MSNHTGDGDLGAAIGAEVSLPGDPGYAEATPWNVAIDVSPMAVVHATGPHDVAATLRWAAANARKVAVQGVGHGPTPRGDEVVLISTRRLNRLDVDAAARTAIVGAGVAAGALIEAAAAHGMAPVAGSSTTVGVVGSLTGGGCGPLVRSHGISSDWVRAFTVVTGDGEVHRVSADEDADLFWGLRGGKATLGIVTEVELELIELDALYGGGAYFGAEDAPAVAAAWQQWSRRLPREGTTSICILQLPEGAPAPPPLVGRMTLAVRFAWLGDPAEGARLAGELLQIAPPVFGGFGAVDAVAIGMIHADPTEPMPFREAGFLLSDLPGDAVDALMRTAGPDSGSPLVMVEVRRMDPPPERRAPADAFCGRGAAYNLMTGRIPMPEPTSGLEASDAVLEALAPWATGYVMPNFVISDDPAMQSRYWDPPTLERLHVLGDRYDPAGVLDTGQVARRPRSAAGGQDAVGGGDRARVGVPDAG